METSQNRAGMKKIFISAMVAMLLINGVTLYFLFSEKQEKNEVIVQKNTLDQDYKTLSDMLDAKKTEMDALSGKNGEMDKIINEQKGLIDQEKAELAELHDKNQLTVESLNKARQTLYSYAITITDLKKQVAEAKEETQHMVVKNTELAGNLTCEQETNTTLTYQKDSLNKKVVAGSYLQIAKVDVQAIKKKNNGQEVPVTKVKATESLKISFETGANKVIDPGKMSLYVRVINPRGETISVAEQGSGIVPETQSAKPIQYTKKADIQWNQASKKVTVYWSRYIKDSGTYRVEVYQQGRVVGHGSVILT